MMEQKETHISEVEHDTTTHVSEEKKLKVKEIRYNIFILTCVGKVQGARANS